MSVVLLGGSNGTSAAASASRRRAETLGVVADRRDRWRRRDGDRWRVLDLVGRLTRYPSAAPFDANPTQAEPRHGKIATRHARTSSLASRLGLGVLTGLAAIFLVDWKGHKTRNRARSASGPAGVLFEGTLLMQDPDAPPLRLGNYEPLLELASGGMATVYVARQIGAAGFERIVVVKRVHPHLLGNRDFYDMFRDEARVASLIRHPNVVPVIDVVEYEPRASSSS